MKVSEYKKVLKECPVYVPVFVLTKVPVWLEHEDGIHVGIELYSYNERLISPTKKGYSIGPTYLKFVEYRLMQPTSLY